MSDPYVDPASGVLLNSLGITDGTRLREAETRLVLTRDIQVAQTSLAGTYDLGHLCLFHRRLFGDIYPWAGTLRTVDIAKGATQFCRVQFLERYATEQVFPGIANSDYLRGGDHAETVHILAVLLADLNALHPFREGNGRTQRAFFRQMAGAAGWRLDWSHLDADDNIAACEAAMNGDNLPLEQVLAPRLTLQ